ncbi:uncharacterized protein LOC125513393 isoform X2 [Triticum urartu]|uniref:uncharacterized protein LOC125513393 isoform X2 n=1 Tax=Triticum urartu TaxID=4572 RepID=UPI002043ED94|nr:uncharacterized protein LOC125513393 isoform X2 [Triticum urartu]
MGRLADAGFPRPGSSVSPVSTRREQLSTNQTMRPAGSTESSPEARQRSPRHAAASRGRGTRHSEAYGFVGSIAASAAALAYIAWAYAPEPWLCHIGATYYPNKRWAVAVPAFVAVAVAQGVVLYVASNFLLAPPPACFNTISVVHSQMNTPGSRRLLCGRGKIKPSSPSRTSALTG